MTKKILLLFALAAMGLSFFSCNPDDEEDKYKTHAVSVQLVYPEGTDYEPVAGVTVKLTNTLDNNSYSSSTASTGIAVFEVPVGVYTVSASESRVDGATTTNLNGSKSSITVADNWNPEEIVMLDLIASKGGSIVIKEIYFGGCNSPSEDGGEVYYGYDNYIILYNNSGQEINIGNLCFGTTSPINSNSYKEDEYAYYETAGWVPGYSAFWTFPDGTDPVLGPGEQIVISLFGAADYSATYSNSVNLDKASYYCMYDTESGFTHNKYTLPAYIPSSHWMKGYRLHTGTAWVFSANSPAIYIFTPEGTSIADFVEDADTTSEVKIGAFNVKKVPVEWVVDAIEIFRVGYEADNGKRIPPAIDGGYIYSNIKAGYSVYRNVDKEATEAIEENEGKIVYGYSLGTVGVDMTYGSTDTSGIDAEASIRNGARIVYKDINNSGSDFHQRVQASLRD